MNSNNSRRCKDENQGILATGVKNVNDAVLLNNSRKIEYLSSSKTCSS
jgi:hypothetical protein